MTVVKAHDTHDITLTVTSDGAAVNLTGATVRVLARPVGSSATPTELDVTVTDATGGIITHTLTGTLDVGPWDVEVEVTKAGATVTYPTTGYERLDVQPDLG